MRLCYLVSNKKSSPILRSLAPLAFFLVIFLQNPRKQTKKVKEIKHAKILPKCFPQLSPPLLQESS